MQVGGPGTKPWTLQSLGCGKPGVRMYLPLALLEGKEEREEEEVMRELVRLRYGVFEEMGGFPGDPRYSMMYCTGQ